MNTNLQLNMQALGAMSPQVLFSLLPQLSQLVQIPQIATIPKKKENIGKVAENK